MAELVMDNPFSTAQNTYFNKTVSDLKDCIDKLKEEFFDTKIPLNDDNQDLHRFCAKLEYLFQAGLKVKTGLLGGKKDYWNYLCDCLNSNKSLNDGIRFVKSVNELRSSLGRGRGLIRFALVQHRLADTVQQCALDIKITSDWYQQKSVWLNQALTSEIVSSLYDLNDLQFDLPIQGCDLDAAWPSFAKKPFGMHGYRPPSRSTSIGSLSSIPSSLQFQASSEADAQSQVDGLEHEKLAAEHKNQQLQQQLTSIESQKEQVETENKLLKNKVTEMEIHSVDVFKKSDGYDVLCEKLANELKLKEDMFSEKEIFLQKQLDESKRTIGSLEAKFLTATEDKTASINSSKMDVQEIKGKVKILENNNKTLKIDLQSTSRELDARNNVDLAKSKLIDMQEKKMMQQKDELERMQKRIEELLASKSADVEKYVKASDELQTVKYDLQDREKAYECLLKSHKELKEMLHSIEQKSGDIGKLAKEKLTKYSAENNELKERVKQLEANTSEDNTLQNLPEVTVENKEMKTNLDESLVKLKEKENALEASQTELSVSQQEINNLKDVVESLKSGLGEKENQLVEQMVKLQSETTQLQVDLISFKEKSDCLERLLETKSKEWSVEKESLVIQVEKQSADLQVITTNLKDKIGILETCEKQMEEEKKLLTQQLEGQTAEIEMLKEELTGLSQLLGPANENEVDGSSPVSLCTQLKSLMDKNQILEKSIETMETRNKDLFTNIKESETNFEKAQVELGKMKSERESLEATINSSQTVIGEFEKQLQQKSTELDSLVKTQTEFESHIKDLEVQMKQSKSSSQELDDESKTKDKMIAAKEQQFQAVNEKVALMQQLIDQLEEDKEMAENETMVLRNEVESCNSQISGLKTDLEKEASLKTELENNFQKLTKKYDQTKSELEEKDVYANEKETDYLQKVENQTKLESQLEQNDKYKTLLENKVQALSQSLEEAQQQTKELISTNQTKIEELEKEVKEKINENIHIKEIVQKLEKTKEENLTDIQALKDIKVKLSSKIDKLECDCDNYLQDVNKFQKENETLTRCVKSMESNQASSGSEIEKLKSEVDSLRKQLEQSNHLHQDLITQTDHVNSSMTEKDQLISELKEKVDGMTEKICELDQEVEKGKTEKENLLKKVDEVEAEKGNLSETMNASYFELKEKLGQYECENEKLREEIQNAISDKEKMYSEMSEDNSCLQSEIESTKEELRLKSENVLDLEQKNQSLSAEIETFETSITEKDKFISDSNVTNKNVELEVEKLQKLVDSKEKEKNEDLKAVKLHVSELETKLIEKEDEISMLHETHEQERKAMQFQLSTEQMQNQHALQEYKEKESNLQSMTDEIHGLECKIEDFQVTVQKQTEEMKTAQKQHRIKVEELEDKIAHKDNECQLMTEQVLQNNQAIERERTDLVKIKRERKESDSKMESLNTSMTEIEAENIELKKKIIQLIREKDTMWKKSDKLQFKQKLMASQISGVWADSSEITQCTKCAVQFGFTVRKHHCRLCGQIFCYYCCNNWVMTSFSSKQERVCGECLMQQSHLESASEGEDTDNDGDDSSIEKSVQIPSLKSPKWKQKPEASDASNEEEEIADDRPSAIEADIEQAVREEADDDMKNSAVIDSNKLLNMTDENKSVQFKKGATAKECSVSPSDDGYDLITTEEVQESSDVTVPDPDTEMGPLLTSENFNEGNVVESRPELWIQAGKAFSTAVNIDKKGAILTWEFTTYPKDINFSLKYGETEWTSIEESDALIPMCKCNSHKKPINGELTARKPGIYTLIFDNKSSRFTSKKLTYKLELKIPSSTDEEDLT